MIAIPLQVQSDQTTIPITVAPDQVSVPSAVAPDIATIPLDVTPDTVSMSMEVEPDTITVPIQMGVAVVAGNAPPYVGPYSFTPSQQSQTVSIAGHRATQDITIDPIPSNYGLITWNGAFLTVS